MSDGHVPSPARGVYTVYLIWNSIQDTVLLKKWKENIRALTVRIVCEFEKEMTHANTIAMLIRGVRVVLWPFLPVVLYIFFTGPQLCKILICYRGHDRTVNHFMIM